MSVLLDTNAFLWQVQSKTGGRLGPNAKKLISQSQSVYVSSITLVEIHIKAMLGKLDAPKNLESLVVESNDSILEFSAAAADAMRSFTSLVRHDPFDRMILAQAKVSKLKLLTSDRTLLDLGLPYIIDATQ